MEAGFDHYKALQARDARFDGWFFVAVRTTRIYCRPVCPARTPRASSCLFLPTAATAEQAGYRPCLRCRPELAPPVASTATLEQSLLNAIRAQAVTGSALEGVAAATGYSARQLRRLTARAFGVTPVEIMQTERLLFAKKLLQETQLSMMDVALGAGFGSLRRFNALFQSKYRLTPMNLRRSAREVGRTHASSAQQADRLQLRLVYRPPLAWRELLRYLAKRAVPGVENISLETGTYARTYSVAGKKGWLEVALAKDANCLVVSVPSSAAEVLWTILQRLRGLFDLDADPRRIEEHLGTDPVLEKVIRLQPGLRVPGSWDTFELAVRAVLGQQISVAGASTFAARLARRFGEPLTTSSLGLDRLSPTSAVLAATTPDEIGKVGLTRARAATLHALAHAAEAGELAFSPGTSIEDTVQTLQRVPGVGGWTAQYIAMRALRLPDAFPAADLGLRKALSPAGASLINEKQVIQRATTWRPWRAYAALHLWQSLDIQAAQTTTSEPVNA